MTEPTDANAELEKIEKALRDLADVLTGDTLTAAQAQLQARRAAILSGSGVIVQGNNNTVAGPGAILIEGNVYIGPRARDPQEALAIYCRVLRQVTASLPLRGVDLGASDPTAAQKPVGLANVYVDLDTTAQVEIKPQKGQKAKAEEPFGERKTHPLSALEAVIANRCLVLLGDPGSGKSTFVNFVAHCLAAHALEPQQNWLQHLPGWPEAEQDMLPIIVLLRDFARSLPKKLPEQADPQHLWNFINARLKAQKLDFAARPLAQALEEGRVLLLLDGLDEVPTAEQRRFVRQAVQAFLARCPQIRCLVTCRVLSYQPPRSKDDPDLRLPGWTDFALADFDEDKIQRFLKGWYAELARLGTVPGEDAPLLAQRLWEAVQRPDLWRMAPNPLLLTVIALVHAHKGRLPDARAQLYEDTIDILLWRWEQIKAGGSSEIPLRQLLLEANSSEMDLKRTLWRLAYEAHSQAQDSERDQLADINELRLEKALAALKGDDRNWAKQVIEAMKLRAGLLLERAPEIFTFPHRTFQEYLAGAYLSTQGNFSTTAAGLAGADALWREVILLATGRLVYISGDLDKPLALVGELCPQAAADVPEAWRKAWLAGDVLLEIGLHRLRDTVLGCDLLGRVQQRLVGLLQQGALAPRERARAGNTLASLGDPRFDPDHWYLPREEKFGFVEIPAGPFRMGSTKEDKDAQDREQPQHEVTLPAYFIARYPVTVAQFRAFVEDSGFEPGNRNCLRSLPNHPVVYVSWHEALAYCRWLSEKIGKEVSLPNEAEWEKAARGTEECMYPWGNEAYPDKANYYETGIGTTSAVGCFPGGASPYGCLDMSGNVWQWTRSLYDKYPYPDDPKKRAARENLEDTSGSCVLRGSSFGYNARYARCAVRFNYYPVNRYFDLGFRVIAASLF